MSEIWRSVLLMRWVRGRWWKGWELLDGCGSLVSVSGIRLVLAISALVLISACTGEPETVERTSSPSASSTRVTTTTSAMTPTSSRASSTSTTTSVAQVEGAAVLWRQDNVGMLDWYLASSGELVLMDADRVYVADGFGGQHDLYNVSAFAVGSGDLVWQRHDLTEGVDDVFLQAAANDILIVNGQYAGVTAVEAASGATIWTFGFPAGYGAVRSTVAGNQIIVAATAPSEGDLRPPLIYSLNLEDGSKSWETALADGTQAQWHSPPTGDGLVFVATTLSYPESASGNMIHALDVGTGEIRWTRDLGGKQSFSFFSNVVVDDVLIVRVPDGGMKGLNIGDGSELWTYPHGDPLAVSSEGSVYGFDGGILKLDPLTGEAISLIDRATLHGFTPFAAVISGRQLIFAGRSGIQTFDLDSSRRIWRWEPSSVTAKPAVWSDKAAVLVGERSVSLIQVPELEK